MRHKALKQPILHAATVVPCADTYSPQDTAATAQHTPLSCVLVDPSLFTAPYDAALTEGLLAAGVEPHWVTRPLRQADREEIAARYVSALFYKRADAARWSGALRGIGKGVAHVLGLFRLAQLVHRRRPDVIHVQWVVLPLLDIVALWLIRRRCALVLTVHDPLPYNGERLSPFQRFGFDLPIRLADRVIVHTEAGRHTLVARGIGATKISVVPHGPLTLHVAPRAGLPRDPRWTFVLFGEIKPYKGVDVLVEAVGRLSSELRQRARVIIAGRPRMSLAAIEHRICELGLQDSLMLHAQRLSDQEMADLFAEADCFVFPYRAIDASGVYFLTRSLGKWIIASRVGIFAEDLQEGTHGELLPAGDVDALAAALTSAILQRPQPPALPTSESWVSIGLLTRAVYRQALAAHE